MKIFIFQHLHQYLPMKEKNTNEDMKIIKVSCGEAHIIVLNNKKRSLQLGFSSNGQLGLGFCVDSFEVGTGLSKSRIFTPQKIKTFDNLAKIRDIRCGKTFNMFITTDGALYSCGVNDLIFNQVNQNLHQEIILKIKIFNVKIL